MAKIDNRGSATMQLTDDEFAQLRDRAHAEAPNSELSRVLAEAQPAADPLVEPVFEPQTYEQMGGTPPEGTPPTETVLVQVREVRYTYAISVPPDDQPLAAGLLRTELSDPEAAELVANNDPEVIA